MVFRQLQQKRSVKPPKQAEAYQCLNQAYRYGSRLVLLLLLINICIAVSLNAHADSDTHWQQGAVSLTVDFRWVIISSRCVSQLCFMRLTSGARVTSALAHAENL
jgi:hypothetical protein